MELLEREAPLAALAKAHAAASDGRGSVVLVTGEPGIGKTSLVGAFTADVGADGRVLWGLCDDLNIPRPLGPLRHLAGPTSEGLKDILAEDASASEVHARLLEELGMPPHPTILVLEDVHWADSATLDAVTVIARRIVSLPALLLLTYRDGGVAPGHPLHAALSAVPPPRVSPPIASSAVARRRRVTGR